MQNRESVDSRIEALGPLEGLEKSQAKHVRKSSEMRTNTRKKLKESFPERAWNNLKLSGKDSKTTWKHRAKSLGWGAAAAAAIPLSLIAGGPLLGAGVAAFAGVKSIENGAKAMGYSWRARHRRKRAISNAALF